MPDRFLRGIQLAAQLNHPQGFVDYPHLTRDPLLANLRGVARFEQFLPVAKAKWQDVTRQLEGLAPL